MKKIYLLCLVLMLALPLLAQEESPAPEPFTRADNECYVGGTMEGHCEEDIDGDGVVSQAETDWAWSCGWYMARFNDGTFSRDEVAVWCSILLPALTENTVISASNVYCFMDTAGSFDIKWCVNINTRSLTNDEFADGIIEWRYYIADGAVCPIGTTMGGQIVNISDNSLRNWFYKLGFDAADMLCIVP